MAAVLAAAEYAHADAKTAITGIVLSYEVQADSMSSSLGIRVGIM
jgi:2-methylcitrate dehydratase PrpD